MIFWFAIVLEYGPPDTDWTRHRSKSFFHGDPMSSSGIPWGTVSTQDFDQVWRSLSWAGSRANFGMSEE